MKVISMDRPVDVDVENNNQPRAYEPRNSGDLENVIDGMELIEDGDEELEEAVNNIRYTVNQWLRNTLGMTNHPFAIRSLNNPELNEVEVKDRFADSHMRAEGIEDIRNPRIGRENDEEIERNNLIETDFTAEIAGEEFFGINRHIPELGDYRDLQWWVLHENGSWGEEARAGTPEHLVNPRQIGETYGFRIEADGEQLSRDEIISMSENIDRREISTPQLTTSIPEIFMQYESKDEVIENEYNGDSDAFEQDLRLAEEMGMVDDDELTLMGYLAQFDFDQRSPDRRRLVNLLSGNGDLDSFSQRELEQLNGLIDLNGYEAEISLEYDRRGRNTGFDLTEVFDIDIDSSDVEVSGNRGMLNISFPVDVDLDSGDLEIPAAMEELVERYGRQIGLDPNNPMALMRDQSGSIDLGIVEIMDLFVDGNPQIGRQYIQDNPSTFQRLYEDDFARVTDASLDDVRVTSIRQESHEESLDTGSLDIDTDDLFSDYGSSDYIEEKIENDYTSYLDDDDDIYDIMSDGGLPQDPEAIAEHLEGLTAEEAVGSSSEDLEQVINQAVSQIVQSSEDSFAVSTEDGDYNALTRGLISALVPDYGRNNDPDDNTGSGLLENLNQTSNYIEGYNDPFGSSDSGSDPVEVEDGSTTFEQNGSFRSQNELMIDRGVLELMPYQDTLEDHGMEVPNPYGNEFRTETINDYDELDDETKTRLRALDEADYISLMEQDGTATLRMNRDERHTKVILDIESEWTPEEAQIIGSDRYRTSVNHQVTDIEYEESELIDTMKGMLEPTTTADQAYREAGTGITLTS
jgi:hypothetical protein